MSKLEFVSPEGLFRLTAETTAYTVEGLLPSRGLSLWTAKPKQGKSSCLRQLAVAVAKGQPFLGRSVQQGTVLYLSLEEKDSEVQAHLKQLGWTAEDPIYTRFGALDRGEALAGLQEAIQHYADVRLVIVDPLFRFVGSVHDGNSYVQVSDALEPLLELARNFNVHVAVAHRSRGSKVFPAERRRSGIQHLVLCRSSQGCNECRAQPLIIARLPFDSVLCCQEGSKPCWRGLCHFLPRRHS